MHTLRGKSCTCIFDGGLQGDCIIRTEEAEVRVKGQDIIDLVFSEYLGEEFTEKLIALAGELRVNKRCGDVIDQFIVEATKQGWSLTRVGDFKVEVHARCNRCNTNFKEIVQLQPVHDSVQASLPIYCATCRGEKK